MFKKVSDAETTSMLIKRDAKETDAVVGAAPVDDLGDFLCESGSDMDLEDAEFASLVFRELVIAKARLGKQPLAQSERSLAKAKVRRPHALPDLASLPFRAGGEALGFQEDKNFFPPGAHRS